MTPKTIPLTRVVLIRNASAHDFGGAERFPVDLAIELKKQGYDPLVVSRSAKLLRLANAKDIKHIRGWWWPRQNWSGLRAVLFPFYLLWQLLLFVWYLQLLLRLRPAIVHAQSKDDFIAASFAARLLGKRLIWTDHADLKYIFANHNVWYKNPVGKLVYAASHLAHAITLVSHSEQKLIEKSLGKKLGPKYRVVHNGVPDTKIAPKPRKDSEKNAFIFCSTSRLVGAKGIGELIVAFNELRQDESRAELWVVGDGPEQSAFKLLAKGTDGVSFFGHSDEPLSYVAAADAFVHPSYHEGFSISIVEAAMLAKPIIACDVGGNPEIIKDNSSGLLIEPKGSKPLAAAMKRLLSDPSLCMRLGQSARQIYEHSFRFDEIVEKGFLPIYEE